MTRLEWDRIGEKTYETGVDRGVLYPADGQPPVIWKGLVTIEEINANVDAADYFFEGEKYSISVSNRDFQAKIFAYAAPLTFAQYEGSIRIGHGLYAMNQQREPFGLCYRTRFGNDVDGPDFGYKIHLVYNAYAFLSPRSYRTDAVELNPVVTQWDISTVPYHKREYIWFDSDNNVDLDQQKTAYIPGSHFTVSTRSISPQKLSYLENVLYGTEHTEPELPSPAELIEIVR